MAKLTCIISLLLLFSGHVYARQYHFGNIQVKDGSRVSVFNCVEDPHSGYIWMATGKGIFRYDGKTFKRFGHDEGLTETEFFFVSRIPGTGSIFAISNNFKLFLYEGQRFRRIATNEKIAWVAYDHRNTPYILTRLGSVYRMQAGRLSHYSLFSSETPLTFYNLVYSGKGNFLLSSNKWIVHLSAQKKRKVLLKDNDSYEQSVMPRIFPISKTRTLVTNVNGIYETCLQNTALKLLFPLKHNQVCTMYADSSSKDVWVGTLKGLWKFRDGIFDHAHLENYLDGSLITNICKTSEGLYLFSTSSSGIYTSLLQSGHYGKPDGMRDPDLRYIRKQDERIYLFAENNDIFQFHNDRLSALYKGKWPPNNIKNICYDSTGLLVYYNIDPNVLIGVYSTGVRPVQKPSWMGFSTGMIGDMPGLIYNYDVKNVRNNARIKYLDSMCYWTVYGRTQTNASGASLLLIDTVHAVNYFSVDNGYLVQEVRNPTALKFIDTHTDILCMTKVNDDLFIAGTDGKGLILLHKDTPVQFIDEFKGLSGNTCYKMSIDGKSIVWVMTDKGLSRISLGSNNSVSSITNFNEGNVLGSPIVTDFLLDGNSVFVTGPAGLYTFDKRLQFQSYSQGLKAEQVSINDRDTTVSNSYSLSYDLNTISFRFRLPTLLHAGKILYQYILTRDRDTITNEISAEEKIQFLSLLPANYTLHVSAMNGQGSWSTLPQAIRFTIRPVFWRTWWFITSVLTFFIAVVIIIIRYRLALHRNESRIKARLLESELKALRLHMNPHFIFNTLNSLQRFVLNEDPLKANKYIARFSKLIRWVMEYSDKQQLTLEEEHAFLKLYIELEQLRFEHTFISTIEFEPGMDIHNTYISALVIQPFVENAIKYGLAEKKEGALRIQFTGNKDYIYVTVEDNGAGREKVKADQARSGKETRSTGISYTEERLKLLIENDQVKPVKITDLYNEGEACGTRIELVIPILK